MRHTLKISVFTSLLACAGLLYAEDNTPADIQPPAETQPAVETSTVAPQPNAAIAPLFDDIGNFHRVISTANPQAQRYFDQGMTLFYGFEWSEAIRSFREAIDSDPKCALCYWGLALASGYKGNAPMSGHEYADAKQAIEKALKLSAKATPVEQGFIKALASRLQHKPKSSNKPAGAFTCHANGDTATPEEIATYARNMKKLAEKFPKDGDAKVLYTYALFDQISWNFYDAKGKAAPETQTMISTLQSVLAKEPSHIGANHYYIHVIEGSAHPEKAGASGERLKTAVPVSEHLVHMPTHVYFLTGRYHEGTEANENAIAAYKNYGKVCRSQGFEPEVTYLFHHDLDFLRTTACMEGRSAIATKAAQDLLANLPATTLAADPSLQWFIPVPYYVAARFGQWDAILAMPKPDATFHYAIGMWNYAEGMAFAHTDKIAEAEAAGAALAKTIAAGVGPETLGKSGLNLLKIAQAVLQANIANVKGDEKGTITQLKVAAQIQTDMGYHEPPDWYFPVKEMLADAYLKWNKPKDAVALYNADLKQYPKNGWALYGLAKAERASGDTAKAEATEQAFKEAWQYADVPAPVMMIQ